MPSWGIWRIQSIARMKVTEKVRKVDILFLTTLTLAQMVIKIMTEMTMIKDNQQRAMITMMYLSLAVEMKLPKTSSKKMSVMTILT